MTTTRLTSTRRRKRARFAASGGSAGADTTATGGAETTAPAEPFAFTAPEGDDTATFPGEPQETNQETALPDGTTLPITFYLYQFTS